MKQPEALRLAAALIERHGVESFEGDAAAELRRLHEAHDWQYRMAGERLRRIEKLETQRDALLEVCKTLVALPGTEDWAATLRLAVEQARAAIKAVEGENHAKNL